MAAMARVGGSRVVVRLSAAERVALEAAAGEAGVALAGLVREAALRAAWEVAREVREGRLRIRGANGGGGVVEASGSGGLVSASRPAPDCPVVDRAEVFRRATGNG